MCQIICECLPVEKPAFYFYYSSNGGRKFRKLGKYFENNANKFWKQTKNNNNIKKIDRSYRKDFYDE